MPYIKIIATVCMLGAPSALVFGSSFDPSWATSFLIGLGFVIGALVPLLIGIALLMFIWGVVQFMASVEEHKRGEGKRKIVWGLISLFVIVSVWGLVALLQTLLGISGAKASAPQGHFDPAPPSTGSGTLPRCPSCCCNQTAPHCVASTYSCTSCTMECG